tara:strand:+ start:244 stop:558 length:315 start_codon:yes stop_codon:yes gene_type:complete
MTPTFKDIKFETHPHSGGWAGNLKFHNGVRMSIVCGDFAYCTPKLTLKNVEEYSSFEVALLDSTNEFCTKKIIPEAEDDVIGWASPKNIEEIISKIETFKKGEI